MNTRLLLVSGLVAVAAASQAAVTFTTLGATTNGSAGLQTFVPTTAGNTITGNVTRTATSPPVTLNLDFKAMTSTGYLNAVTFDLYFLAPTSGVIKGTFAYNPVGIGPGGGDADLAGGVQYLTSNPTHTYESITSLGTTTGGLVKISRTILLSGVAPKWHFVLDDAFKNATLKQVDVTVNPVPEPASLAALAIGGLGLMRRRRKA